MKNVLIVGTGGIGKRHIRGFLKTERARVSVVEPDEQKRKEVVEAYDVAGEYADTHDVDLTGMDLAVICAPAHVHIPLGMTCAEAGLPFLLEKPLAVTMDGVDPLIERVDRQGLAARVAYVRRAAPELIEMRRQILAGRIGELRMCYLNASQEFPKYRPDFQTTYYAKAATGGGAILDCASHFIDVLIWLFGEAREVMAMYDRLQLPGVEVEDTCLISIRFQSGCLAQISINQFQKPNTNTIEIVGTEGNLMLDMSTLKFAADDSGEWEARDFMEGMRPLDAHEARFRFQADMFMDVVEGKPDHMATLVDARHNLRIALAAKESDKTKRIVAL